MSILQNFLIYAGCYSVVCGIWKLYEQIIYKKITPRACDTLIALAIAFGLWLLVRI